MSLPLEVRLAEAADFSFIEAIARELDLSVDCGREASLDQSRLLTLVSEEERIGFALFWIVAGELELLDIGVKASAQKRGFGALLLTGVLDRGREEGASHAFLEVRRNNEPAKRLYERAGFVVSYVREGYYADGEDALVYGRELERLSPER